MDGSVSTDGVLANVGARCSGVTGTKNLRGDIRINGYDFHISDAEKETNCREIRINAYDFRISDAKKETNCREITCFILP